MSANKKKKWHINTSAVHSARVPEDQTGSVTTGIFPTSTYRVAFPGDESGYVYSRSNNPTRSALESTLATLENGTSACAFSSGLAATATLLHLLKSGDHIVALNDLYGGTRRQFEQVMREFSLEFSYVDGRNPEDFAKAVKSNTRLFWIETPTNPLLHLIDIEAVATIARKHDILIAVDNTFATPYIQQPLDLGADIVHHSMSKYLGGHCDVIGGALITRDETLGEKIKYHQNAIGTILSPFDSWLTLRGIKTLSIRMERHSSNAMQIVKYLKTVDQVDRIYYPGIDGKPLPNKMRLSGGMLSFDMKADIETVKAFATATTVFVLAESLGGVESLLNHPALMTHASIPPDIRTANGIGDSLIRLSVGIEHINDLIDDLKSAFSAVQSKVAK